jgi:hypothetical protein
MGERYLFIFYHRTPQSTHIFSDSDAGKKRFSPQLLSCKTTIASHRIRIIHFVARGHWRKSFIFYHWKKTPQ